MVEEAPKVRRGANTSAVPLQTDPTASEEELEKLEGNLEFVAIGLLAHEDPQRGWSDEWGAPSEVLMMTVPTDYQVPAALIEKPATGQ